MIKNQLNMNFSDLEYLFLKKESLINNSTAKIILHYSIPSFYFIYVTSFFYLDFKISFKFTLIKL